MQTFQVFPLDREDGSQLLSKSASGVVDAFGHPEVCPCPHPPPVDKTMSGLPVRESRPLGAAAVVRMARYDKLEDGLRKNWAWALDSRHDFH